MSGVRIGTVYKGNVTEKELKIYFSKPENGGGAIESIYFPLFNNDAVIIFEDEHTADLVISYYRKQEKTPFFVSPLPLIQAFQEVTAKVDVTIMAVLQSTEAILDEIRHVGNLHYHYDNSSNQATLTGNWYQLEYAWAKIDSFMHQQKFLQHQISDDVGRKIDRSARLPKGKQKIKGDSDRPIISLPDTYTTEEECDDVENKHIVGIDPKENTDEVYKPAIIVSNQAGKYKTNVPDDESRLPKRSAAVTMPTETRGKHSYDAQRSTPSVAMASAQLKDMEVTEKHVSFKLSEQSKKSQQGNTSTKQRSQDVNPKTTQIMHNRPEDLRSLEFEYCNMTVNIYTGEITLVETDVIVNAAMGPLMNAGGVALAIARAASPEMQRQCEDHIKEYGSLATTEVMHTCAGGSLSDKVKHILHAVGPVWSGGPNEDLCKLRLMKAFLNCFNYGNNKLKVSTMTLPVISSGTFGCPLEICIRAFVDAILLFISEHEQETLQLKEVHLINNNADNTALTVIQVRKLIQQGLEGLTAVASDYYKKVQASGAERTRVRARADQSGTSAALQRESKEIKQPKQGGRPLPPVPQPDSKTKTKK